MAEQDYRISVEGEGLSVERLVPQDVARDVITFIMGGGSLGGRHEEEDGTQIEDGDLEVSRGQRPKVSAAEFLRNTEAQRGIDKIVALGSYLTNHLERPDFTEDDIKEQFRAAREPLPKNWSRDFRWAVSSGWIATHANTGTHYVTNSGQEAVGGKFSDDFRKKTRLSPKAKRKARKPTGKKAAARKAPAKKVTKAAPR